MKNLILFILFTLLFSCSIKKSYKNENTHSNLKEIELTFEESKIVNDFLIFELESEKYKNYKNLEIILIEEAGNGIENLDSYEYSYQDYKNYNKNISIQDKERLGWLLDSLQVIKLKEQYLLKKKYQWKKSDVKNYIVTIMKKKDFNNLIKTGKYIDLPEKIILNLKKPLIINNNSAFISLSSGNSKFGFTSLNNYTVLMRKINEKWIMISGYESGRFD